MLRHPDGFNTYGTSTTSRANMLLHPTYVEVAHGECSVANPYGLGSHHFRWTASNTNPLRMSMGGTLTEALLAGRFCVTALPGSNISTVLFQVRDSGNDPQVSVVLASTGDIIVLRGNRGGAFGGTQIGITDEPVISANVYAMVECYFKISDTVGEVEVRVDGITVINLTGVDTMATLVASMSQYIACNSVASDGVTIDITDHSFCDVTGSLNNDFLGDVQWIRRDMVSDAALAEWTRNTGSADYAAVDDVAQDGDTTYLQGTVAGNVSEFEMQDVPSQASEIVAVVLRSTARRADFGLAEFNTGLVSSLASPESTVDGATIQPGISYATVDDIYETDPATGVPFSPVGYNATRAKLERPA